MNYQKNENIILGNRYELISKIGGGGMALVFKARCKLLNRFVAIKVLKDEYTSDEEFVKRFLVEAQSAASLSHPNIVPIYDVGKDDNVHYIVMEYVDGKTLKDYIEGKGKLHWKEAVDIAIQICLAIEHAHKNHIIHRDIKPHNILITKEGIAKVTDFGIARATSASTITMAGGAIGSVHYISPEQARGFITDEKSDIYSLGIVLYEMITGKVPFNGESPIAVALQHIQNEPTYPIELDESIPIGVNSIISNAIKKEKNKRYTNATQILTDLQTVKIHPNKEFIIQQNTGLNNSATIRVPIPKKISDNYIIESNNTETKNKVPFWLGISTSAIIIIAIMIFTVIRLFPILGITSGEKREYVVENYIGRNYDEVKLELEAKNIKVQEDKRRYDDKIPKNIILSQSKTKGEKIKLGSENIITFEVSNGPEPIKIPNLQNVDYRQAEIKLLDLGLEPIVEEEFSNDINEGLVIRTEPEHNSEVTKSTKVKIYKSKGKEIMTIEVPNVVGKTKAAATKLLTDAGLILGTIEPSDLTDIKDSIISQDPAAGSKVAEKTPVNITFDKTKIVKRKVIKETLSLNDPEKYGAKIDVFIEVTPSDTGVSETLLSAQKDKSAFPLSFKVSVPTNGNTKVRVYLDKKLYTEFIEY